MVRLSHLQRCRLEAALTQQELAERAGLSRNAVTKLEKLKTEPRPPTLRRLAAALGVSPGDLMEPEHSLPA